ncbi:M23 family metallopeptidase [Anaerobranca gottschalkii]|uniref:Peptidase family M23 n=1 Tax=Anaerobranca gottschalkii DSM 13577 TaxID=1120990 RepID=A0A1H9ZVW5_9FIRM|nr:M23 family metallopeptidase [Anaerobranca gottschalkii]SES85921.1 Peptidase family M23 [Anaerobranca gottschalkii DSM 13577]
MKRQKLADILWLLVMLSGFIIFLNGISFSIKYINTFASIIFTTSLLFLPYFKRPNLWTKVIAFIGFIYILIVTMLKYSLIRIPFLRFIIVIPVFLSIGVLIINIFYPRLFNDNKKVKHKGYNIEEVSNKDEYVLEPKPLKKHPIKATILYFLSQYLLCFLNPLQLYQMLLMFVGNTVAVIRGDDESYDSTYKQKIEYNLPFLGEWIVYNGGTNKENSHSWDIINQRYAYDFIKIDSNRSSHKSDGYSLEDYYCYGEPIVAPADGQVVELKTNVADAKKPGTMLIDFLSKDIRGNYVIIKHAEDEYSVIAHLIPNSIVVKKGQYVKKGQLLGKCGNSGHSTEPHLHFHLQNKQSFYFAKGVPIKFSNIQINGNYHSEAFIKRNDRVKNIS